MQQIELLKATRTLLYNAVKSLSLDEVNTVPPNFNNSIAWNVVHVVVTQQLLHNGLSNNLFQINEEWIPLYRKGTKPESALSEDDWNEVLQTMQNIPDRLHNDFTEKKFETFKEYPTSYGYVLHNIEEALDFNNVHEALHLGYIMSMKKALGLCA